MSKPFDTSRSRREFILTAIALPTLGVLGGMGGAAALATTGTSGGIQTSTLRSNGTRLAR